MEAYTLYRWKKNKRKRKCPWCGVNGLYHHWIDGKRHYHLCKWCGILQDVGKEPKQCIFIGCKTCGYNIWTTRSKGKRCYRCKKEMVIFKNPKDEL